MTVGEFSQRVTSSELTEWAAYEAVYGPLGPTRGDWHAAQVAQAIHGQWVKKSKPLGEYLVKWDNTPENAESVAGKFKQWVSQFGGRE